jgi:hypothetical protein
MFLKAIVNILAKFKAWFCNLELKIGNLNLFGRTYHNELVIVVESIEKIYRKKKEFKKEPEELALVKNIIKNRMKDSGLTRDFNRLLIKHKIMKEEKKNEND